MIHYNIFAYAVNAIDPTSDIVLCLVLVRPVHGSGAQLMRRRWVLIILVMLLILAFLNDILDHFGRHL